MKTNNNSNGFSTLELLIAFAVMTLSMTAVIMVAFGNQSIAIDTELAQRGLYIAQQKLEKTAADLHANFNTAVHQFSFVAHNDIFDTQITALDISECAKRVKSSALWNRDQRNLRNSLSMIITDPEISEALGGDCATEEPADTWDTPQSLGSISPSDFSGQGTDIALATINGTRYAFLTTNAQNNNDFYTIDVSDPLNVNSGTDVTALEIGESGLNGLAVAKVNDVPYAFVLNNANTEQVRILNLSNPTSPTIVSSITLQNLNYNCVPPSSPCKAGQSIFYYDEHLYIGTNYLAFGLSHENHEFHVYDVSTPSTPTPSASIDVNRNIYDIEIANGIAYLATGPGSSAPYNPLQIYDMDPASSDYLDKIGQFTIGIDRNGTSVDVLGDRIYFGLSRTSSGNNFYILDGSDPTSPTQLAVANTNTNNSSIGALSVHGNLAFIGIDGANSQNSFQIWNISDLSALHRVNVCGGNPFPQNNTGLRFADNFIFSSFRSNEPFRVFYDSPSLCTP